MTEPHLALWNLSRASASGVEVDRGPAKRMLASAAARNGTVRAMKADGDIVFVAVPLGHVPTLADIPPLPEPASPPEPRPMFVIYQDAHGASGVKIGNLLGEAYERGKAEQRQEGRKSLGEAWGAFLGMVPADFWRELRYHDPELHAQLLAFLEGR